jgi:hypothetical protein
MNDNTGWESGRGGLRVGLGSVGIGGWAPMAYHPSRIATHDRKWSDIAGHHRACSDYCAFSDPSALKHEHSLAHPGPIFHHREIDRRCPVIPHRFIEIVGAAVLLKEHAMRTDDDAMPESGSVYSASWANTRPIGHV